jgi:hypothetical protein
MIDSLDLRQPNDVCFLVAYYGTDIGGADYLQNDGTWKRHGRENAMRLIRPEAERWAERIQPTFGIKRIHLWIAQQGEPLYE